MEQMEALPKLSNRNFIIQTPDSGEPKLLEIPRIERPRFDPREIEVLTRDRLSKIDYIPFDPMELEVSKDKVAKSHQRDLVNRPKRILRSFLNDPFISMNERCLKENIHPEEMGKEIDKLVENKLIVVQPFHFGKGKPKAGALLAKAGYEFLGITDSKDRVPGKGSLRHRYLQHLLHKALPNSFIETGGADVVQYLDNGGKAAFEIELEAKNSNDHFLENIRRDLTFADKVIILAADKTGVKFLKNKAEEKLTPEVLEKTEFKTVKEILNATPF